MRYASLMQRIALAATFALAACKTEPMRPIPSADWTRGAAATVQIDSARNAYGMATGVKRSLDSDLRTAGLHVTDVAAGQGELDISLATDNDSSMQVAIDRNGESVERYTLAYGDLSCNQFPHTNLDVPCIAREIAARAITSPAVVKAMGRGAPAAAPGRLAGKLAVLELRNFAKDLTRENAQYFTDVIRSAALKAQPQLEIMTRENLLVLLQASGRDLASCEGECEVDTGRRIGADQIVSGEIQKLGTLYKLSLRLHDTHEGRLLASTQASGKTVEELDAAVQQAAQDLLTRR